MKTTFATTTGNLFHQEYYLLLTFSMSSWDIIFWNGAVDYIPSSWMQKRTDKESFYYRPEGLKNKYKIKNLVDNCKEIPEDIVKTAHAANYKKTVSTLAEAKKYATKGETQSNLDTEDSDEDEESTEKEKDDSEEEQAANDNIDNADPKEVETKEDKENVMAAELDGFKKRMSKKFIISQ